MFCPKCGTENKDTAKFCKSCGHQLSTKAPPAGVSLKRLWSTSRTTSILVFAVIIVIGGIVVYSLIGGGTGPSGTYANDEYPEVHLELKKDGTLYLTEMGEVWLSGEWEADRGQLRLYFPDLGTIEAEINGNKLIAQEGIIGRERKVWIKQPSSSESAAKNEIVGTWEKVSDPQVVLKFSRDGALYGVDPENLSDALRVGSYQFIDDDTIRLTIKSEPEPAIADVRISDSGDKLVFSMGGTSDTYRRLR